MAIKSVAIGREGFFLKKSWVNLGKIYRIFHKKIEVRCIFKKKIQVRYKGGVRASLSCEIIFLLIWCIHPYRPQKCCPCVINDVGDMYVYICYVYMCTHTIYIHIYIRMYVYTYVYTYIHTYIHAYIHTCIHTHRPQECCSSTLGYW